MARIRRTTTEFRQADGRAAGVVRADGGAGSVGPGPEDLPDSRAAGVVRADGGAGSVGPGPEDLSWPLPAHTLVGRSSACFLQLDVQHASKEHAVLYWSEGAWFLKDLGSRNGTYLDGRRIEAGTEMRVNAGSRLAFGQTDDVWLFEDDAPPSALAMDLASRTIIESAGGLLALPNDEAPEVVVLQGPDGFWSIEGAEDAEASGATTTAKDRQTVQVGATTWCLLLPDPQEATPVLPSALRIESVLFRFGVSRDEERVTLTLVAPHHEVAVQVREFNYVLLTLARLRLQDGDQPVAERGWVDREVLLKMLRMRSTALNVTIHRARQQLLNLGLGGAAGIVEVRRRARRFGSDRIEIGPL